MTIQQNIMRFDRGELRSPVRTEEGYILAEGYMSKPGILEYRDSNGNIIRELITAEELHRVDSLNTLGRKPLTLQHPSVVVGPTNVATYGCGDVDGDISIADNGYIRIKMAVRRSDCITSIDNGDTVEISPGYFCDVDHTPGIHPQFGAYDAIQRNRRYNHVAIVDRARGGPEIRMRLDSEDISLVDLQKDDTSTSIEHENIEECLETNVREDALKIEEVVSKVMACLKIDKLEDLEAAVVALQEASEKAPEVQKNDSAFDEIAAIEYSNERFKFAGLAQTHGVDIGNLKNSEIVSAIAKKISPELRVDASVDFCMGLIAGTKVVVVEEPILKFDGKVEPKEKAQPSNYDPRLQRLRNELNEKHE